MNIIGKKGENERQSEDKSLNKSKSVSAISVRIFLSAEKARIG